MSTIAPTLDAASPKRRAIYGGFVLHVDRSGDGERDYETFTGQTRRGLHHTQLGVSTSVLSHQGPGLTDSLVSLVL